jgi:DNA-binding NtrC family response regulator
LLRRQGLDLLKRVRDLGVNAPVLMMSGDYESRKEADALIEGAFGYLHKPFDLRELTVSSPAPSLLRPMTERGARPEERASHWLVEWVVVQCVSACSNWNVEAHG